ncbi:hypothetical protein CR513_46817, partial [Mucuna pruriens]
MEKRVSNMLSEPIEARRVSIGPPSKGKVPYLEEVQDSSMRGWTFPSAKRINDNICPKNMVAVIILMFMTCLLLFQKGSLIRIGKAKINRRRIVIIKELNPFKRLEAELQRNADLLRGKAKFGLWTALFGRWCLWMTLSTDRTNRSFGRPLVELRKLGWYETFFIRSLEPTKTDSKPKSELNSKSTPTLNMRNQLYFDH